MSFDVCMQHICDVFSTFVIKYSFPHFSTDEKMRFINCAIENVKYLKSTKLSNNSDSNNSDENEIYIQEMIISEIFDQLKETNFFIDDKRVLSFIKSLIDNNVSIEYRIQNNICSWLKLCQWDDVLKPFIYEHKTVFFNYVDMFSFINTLSIPKDFLIDFTDSLNKFCLENNFNFTHVDLNISEFGFEQLIENENMSSYTVYFLLKNNFINGLIKNNKSIIIKAINKIKNDKLLLYNFFMNNYIEDSNMDDFGVFKEIDFIVK